MRRLNWPLMSLLALDAGCWAAILWLTASVVRLAAAGAIGAGVL